MKKIIEHFRKVQKENWDKLNESFNTLLVQGLNDFLTKMGYDFKFKTSELYLDYNNVLSFDLVDEHRENAITIKSDLIKDLEACVSMGNSRLLEVLCDMFNRNLLDVIGDFDKEKVLFNEIMLEPNPLSPFL